MGKKIEIETKMIDGFSITYEREDGRIFAVGSCPQCGHTEESIQLGSDAGKITASKLKLHVTQAHPPPDKKSQRT